MKCSKRFVAGVLVAALLSWAGVPGADAKSYSSGGGHSYSSHSSSSGSSHSFSSGSHSSSSGHSSSGSSSHSSSSGGSSYHSSSGGSSSSGSGGTSTRSSGGGSTYSSGGGSSHTSTGNSGSSGGSSKSSGFSSGSGHSYSSGSSSGSSSSDRHSYTSGKSYSSGSGRSFSSSSGSDNGSSTAKSYGQSSTPASSGGSTFTYDSAAAQARQQEVSKANYSQYKKSQAPSVVADSAPTTVTPTYQGKPPPVITSGGSYSRPTVYIPDSITISTRPVRIYNYYNPYYSRPWVSYNDPYNSFFWWWLLDRSLDDRAYWAYHHHYDMDPARYDALMATDQQLQTRVAQLEAQQAPRDSTYVPPGIDRDLMYSDQYVTHNYQNRPTAAGVAFFWILAVPCALAVVVFFIWLIWFKRWQTAT